MSVTIAKPTDPQPSSLDGVKAFFREHGWLCAGGFAALLFATAEGRKPESDELRRFREEIAALPTEEQQQLQLKAVAFRQLNADELATVRAVHQLVQEQPDLAETLSDYHRWLERQPKERRERIVASANPQDALTAIRDARESGKGRGDRSDDEPTTGPRAGGPFGGQGGPGQFAPPNEVFSRLAQMPRLKEAYDDMMRALAKEVGLPERPEKSDPFSVWDHHVRVVAEAYEKLPQDGKRSVREVVLNVVRQRMTPDIAEKTGLDANGPIEMMGRMLVFEGVNLMQNDESARERLLNDLPPGAREHFKNIELINRDKHIAVSRIRRHSEDLAERILKSVVGPRPRGDRMGPPGEEDFGPPNDGPPRNGPGNFGPRNNEPRRPGGQRPGPGGNGGLRPMPNGRPGDEGPFGR